MRSDLDTWADVTGVAIVGAVPPMIDTDGSLWFNTITQRLMIRSEGVWVEIENALPLPPALSVSFAGTVIMSAYPPDTVDEETGTPLVLDVADGDLWYNTLTDKLSVFVDGAWQLLDVV